VAIAAAGRLQRSMTAVNAAPDKTEILP